MTRIVTDAGSFDAPDAWATMEGLGATAVAPEQMADPAAGPRPSLVMVGDARDAAVTPSAYVQTQLDVIASFSPNWRMIDGTVTDAEPGPALVRHTYESAHDGWIVQFQAFWFLGARVSILTATAPAARAAELWDEFGRAVGTFAPPDAPAAV